MNNTENPTNIFTRFFLAIFLGFAWISRWTHSLRQKREETLMSDIAKDETFKIINRSIEYKRPNLLNYRVSHLPRPTISFQTSRMGLDVIKQALLVIFSDKEILCHGLLDQFMKEEDNGSDDTGFSLPVRHKGFVFIVDVAHSEWNGKHDFEITLESYDEED